MGCAESSEAAGFEEQRSRRHTAYASNSDHTMSTADTTTTATTNTQQQRSATSSGEEVTGRDAPDLTATHAAPPCLRKSSTTKRPIKASQFVLQPAGDDDDSSTALAQQDRCSDSRGCIRSQTSSSQASRSGSAPRVRFEQLGESSAGTTPAAAGLPTLPSTSSGCDTESPGSSDLVVVAAKDPSDSGNVFRSAAARQAPPVLFAWDIPSASGSGSSKHRSVDSSVDGLKVSTGTGRQRKCHIRHGDGATSPQDGALAAPTDALCRLLQHR